LAKRAAAFIRSTPWLYSLCSPFRHLSEETLSARIASLSFEEATPWQAYHDRYSLSADGAGHRFERVAELVGGCSNVETLIDLAGNSGFVSVMLARRYPGIKRICCLDYDENAVDKLYRFLKEAPPDLSGRIFTGRLDCMLTDERRFRADCVLALALTHHLLLTQGYSIDAVLGKLTSYASKYLFVEFMPLGLYDGTDNSPAPPDWYTLPWFKEHLSRYADVVREEVLEVNRVLLVCDVRGHGE
jgi:hypothetical protein